MLRFRIIDTITIPTRQNPSVFTAVTLPGLEEVLAEELKTLGALDSTPLSQAVRFRGDMDILYRLNLSLRTSLRVLWEICSMKFRSNEDLYRKAESIPWETFLNPQGTLAVSTSSRSISGINPRYASLIVKDGVVDRFHRLFGKRPSVDRQDPDLRIHLHLEKETATFSVDSSGESLHRRGYRTEKIEAPLNEVLAAGILQLIHWTPDIPLYDPMCGSGTFLIEAGLIAAGIAPGMLRKSFGFQRWKIFDPDRWKRIRKTVQEGAHGQADPSLASHARKPQQNLEYPYFIRGADIDPGAVEISRRNIERAGLKEYISVSCAPFEGSRSPFSPDTKGIVIMNPPYGKRLGDPAIGDLYKKIGDTLKQGYTDSDAWILSANSEGVKQIGLRPFKKYPLKNGP
ncbi:MAG TPA: THUMP domain-containing protein, partial [Spirochaetales bacterium]|nr:THUMP domain-containing protein [Spirochaetales bacterium]